MPRFKASVKRPSGLIKKGGSASALKESTSIKVENVL